MSLPIPTNASVNIERRGTVISSAVAAQLLPARPEIAVTREIPATKAFEIIFPAVVDVAEQDFVIDGATRYKVVGAAHYNTPPAAHSEVVAERIWGTQA